MTTILGQFQFSAVSRPLTSAVACSVIHEAIPNQVRHSGVISSIFVSAFCSSLLVARSISLDRTVGRWIFRHHSVSSLKRVGCASKSLINSLPSALACSSIHHLSPLRGLLVGCQVFRKFQRSPSLSSASCFSSAGEACSMTLAPPFGLGGAVSDESGHGTPYRRFRRHRSAR